MPAPEAADNTSVPLVSVVIGVHNGGTELMPTLNSVLEQTGVSFEVIVVNDGSNDDTAPKLDSLALTEPRLRVIHQPENLGLTCALIRGCAAARGTYIARQDVGDRSLPGRLQAQVAFLEQHPEVVLVSCWTQTVGPRDEFLAKYCPADTPVEASRKLLNRVYGVTHHGAVMFRTSAYCAAGGYRREFYFAQDLDLWFRIVNHGLQAFLPQILYQIQITPQCLSSRYRPSQMQLTQIIYQLAEQRGDVESESRLLAQAESIRPQRSEHLPNAISTVQGNYWIAQMLIQRHDRRAIHYLWSAVRQQPLFVRGWLGFLRLALKISQGAKSPRLPEIVS